MGLRGRAPFVRDWQLRHLSPARVEVGTFEEFEVPDGEAVELAGLAEVDRDAQEGWVWLVQRQRLPSRKALTIVARVTRPGEEKPEDVRIVLVCEGGPSGPGG